MSIRGSKSLDVGFRVLKVYFSNMADVYSTPDTLEQNLLTDLTDNIKDDSVKINVEQIFKLMGPHADVKTI